MAATRTTVQPPTEVQPKQREGLSVQTLIIAALASGLAALIVSRFWENGTIFASAMTPVVVALISEGLRKPMQSDRVVRSVSAVTSTARPRSGRTPTVMAPPTPGVDEGASQREDGIEPGPVRVYGGTGGSGGQGNFLSRLDRRHVRIALVTGGIAFLIAAATLTLPELLFGGSVSGGQRSTTIFGGGSSSSADKQDEKDKTDESSSGESSDGENGSDTTSPQGEGESDSGGDTPSPSSTTPESTTSTSTTTTPPPTTTAPPPVQTPAPTQPAP